MVSGVPILLVLVTENRLSGEKHCVVGLPLGFCLEACSLACWITECVVSIVAKRERGANVQLGRAQGDSAQRYPSYQSRQTNPTQAQLCRICQHPPAVKNCNFPPTDMVDSHPPARQDPDLTPCIQSLPNIAQFSAAQFVQEDISQARDAETQDYDKGKLCSSG